MRLLHRFCSLAGPSLASPRRTPLPLTGARTHLRVCSDRPKALFSVVTYRSEAAPRHPPRPRAPLTA